MKNLIASLFIISGVLYSCNSDEVSSENENRPIAEDIIADSLKNGCECVDALIVIAEDVVYTSGDLSPEEVKASEAIVSKLAVFEEVNMYCKNSFANEVPSECENFESLKTVLKEMEGKFE